MKLPNDKLPVRALILDRELIHLAYSSRTAHGNRPHDEVWDGTLVLYPLPDNEHQLLVTSLAVLLERNAPQAVYPGVNVSDRSDDWLENFRCPDVVVYLATNRAKNSDTHWVGGPDLAVEITSPGEEPRQKLDFYEKVNTREVLIVDREPWSVELYQLLNGKMISAGKSDVTNPIVLKSQALPLTFQMRAATPRPSILVTHTANGQTWMA